MTNNIFSKFIPLYFFLFFSTILKAQELRVTGYSGYVFDDRFETFNNNTSYFNGTILGGHQWGVGLESKIGPDYGIELIYFQMDTEAPINYFDNQDISRKLQGRIQYVLTGGLRYFNSGSAVEPFGGLLLGAVIYTNKEPVRGEPEDLTRFSWGARLGTNVWVSENVGLRIQTQILSAVQSVGGSFYVGSGGSGAGVSAYSTLFQFGIGGGLILRIPR